MAPSPGRRPSQARLPLRRTESTVGTTDETIGGTIAGIDATTGETDARRTNEVAARPRFERKDQDGAPAGRLNAPVSESPPPPDRGAGRRTGR